MLHGFELSFGTPHYAEPIPGASLASSVDVRPEASTVRYAHDSFTVDATWLVPITNMKTMTLAAVMVLVAGMAEAQNKVPLPDPKCGELTRNNSAISTGMGNHRGSNSRDVAYP